VIGRLPRAADRAVAHGRRDRPENRSRAITVVSANVARSVTPASIASSGGQDHRTCRCGRPNRARRG
jgi:hypothetical protein